MEPTKTRNVPTHVTKQNAYVWETESGTLIDLVYEIKDVTNEFYILISKIPLFLSFMQKENTIRLTKRIAKELLHQGILGRKL